MSLEQTISTNRDKINYNLRLKLNNALSKKEKYHLFGKPISELAVLPKIHNNPLDFTSERMIGLVGDVVYAQKENALAVANWALLQGLKNFYGVVDFTDSRLRMPKLDKGDLDNNNYSKNLLKETHKRQFQRELLHLSKNMPPSQFQEAKKDLQKKYLTVNKREFEKELNEMAGKVEQNKFDVENTYELFRRVFSKHFYDYKLLSDINNFYKKLTPSQKDVSNPYIVPDASSLVESIRKVQNHFSHKINDQMPTQLAADLMDERINLRMYNLKVPQDKRALFAVVKNKRFESTMNKYLLTIAQRQKKVGDILDGQIPEWMYTRIVGCRKEPVININDHAGFSITTSDIINIKDSAKYEKSFFNEIKSFYTTLGKSNLAKVSNYKNHFRNDLTKQAVEMYLSPTDKSLEEGLTLPFPEIAGDPSRYFDVLKVSMHLFGAKEMAANHLGDPRIEAHYKYKMKQQKKNKDIIRNLDDPSKLELAEHENFFRGIFDINAFYDRLCKYK